MPWRNDISNLWTIIYVIAIQKVASVLEYTLRRAAGPFGVDRLLHLARSARVRDETTG